MSKFNPLTNTVDPTEEDLLRAEELNRLVTSMPANTEGGLDEVDPQPTEEGRATRPQAALKWFDDLIPKVKNYEAKESDMFLPEISTNMTPSVGSTATMPKVNQKPIATLLNEKEETDSPTGIYSQIPINYPTDGMSFEEDPIAKYEDTVSRFKAATAPPVEKTEMATTTEPIVKKQALLDEYNALLQQKQSGNRNLDLLAAANKIGQGIASGYGAKIDDGSELVNQLRKSQDLPVEGYLGRTKALDVENELQMNDANSDISKFARERATASAVKMGMSPEAIKKLEGMSAKQLEKIGLFKAESQKSSELYFTPIEVDGKKMMVGINKQTGEIEKTVGLKAYADQFRINPETDGIIKLGQNKEGFTNVTGQTPVATVNEKGEVQKPDYSSPTTLNKANPKLYDKFNTLQKSFITDLKDSRDAAAAVTNLNQKLKPGKVKIDSGMLGGIQTQAAKLAGQKGPLTDQDLVKFAGAGGVPAGFSRFFSGNFEGEMTAEDIKFFQEFSNNMAKAVSDDIQNRSAIFVDSTYNEAKDYLPGLSKDSVKTWFNVDSGAPAVQKTTSKQDPKIESYAKDNKLNYEQAKGILINRGYKPNE